MNYLPPKKILKNYADVLVNFALGGGTGIKKGDVVYVVAYEYAKPLYAELLRAILKAGGHVISNYRASNDHQFNFDSDFFINIQEHQLKYFPSKYMKGLVDEIDHSVFIISETDMEALKGIDPKKILMREAAFKPYHDWREQKENKGKFTWTIGLYATTAMAKEAGMSEKQYWDQIIKACFLDHKNPIAKWKSVYADIERHRRALNKLPVDKLHVKGPDADLWIKLGDKRVWNGGSGRNVPSFEIFTSPDWRGTNGWIRFNQPLYRYGNLVTGIELEFKDGKVVRSKAKKNEKLLKQMIRAKNADKIGEFSLTDKRCSRITKFMAETLYDENIGGPEGNTHIALGASYHDCLKGNPAKMKKAGWQKLGFNDSSVHSDIISTAPRTVRAYLKSGKEVVIYKNGKFMV
jgi:aminopeptidase